MFMLKEANRLPVLFAKARNTHCVSRVKENADGMWKKCVVRLAKAMAWCHVRNATAKAGYLLPMWKKRMQ